LKIFRGEIGLVQDKKKKMKKMICTDENRGQREQVMGNASVIGK
jgi:hypothetical protein